MEASPAFELFPVEIGDKPAVLVSFLVVGDGPKFEEQSEIPHGEPADTFGALDFSAVSPRFGVSVPVRGGDGHPEVFEFRLGHPVAVVFDNEFVVIVFEPDVAPCCVGVVGVLDEFGEGDVAGGDQTFSQLGQELAVAGESRLLLLDDLLGLRHGSYVFYDGRD